MKIAKCQTLFSCYLLFSLSLIARQHSYPQVGKQIPPFIFTRIFHYTSDSVTNRDLEGKHVILDFFSKGCKGCFNSFPKMHAIKQKYKGKVEIILVGQSSKGVEEIFENFMKLHSIELPVTYGRDIFDKMKVYGVPTLIWIDTKGIVRAITEETSVTDDNISAFLSDKQFKFWDWSYDAQIQRQKAFDKNRPMLIDNNGGPDTAFMYRSLIRKWILNEPVFLPNSLGTKIPNIGTRRGIQMMGLSLIDLYKLAFIGKTDWDGLDGDTLFGKVFPKLILELRDSSLFSSNYLQEKNLYSYSLLVPSTDSSVEKIKSIMQGDLHDYFGFDATMENRKVPYWAVCVDPDAGLKIRTKGGKSLWGITMSKIELRNIPFDDLLVYLRSCFYDEALIIDRSGFSENIDIHVNVDIENFQQVKDGLSKLGIRLIQRDTIMKAIVIKDPT